ncbi:MAG: esterase family protein [Acidobacteriota bacterium]|nr:esterase family protein [Acidobacteriota bacterium]
MTRQFNFIFCFLCIVIGSVTVNSQAYAFNVSQVLAQTTSGKLIEAKVHSRALENNLLGDTPDQQVAVYLPPSYETSPAKRFPVIYFLHGYAPENQVMERGKQFQSLMNKLIATGAVREMIVVVPNGRNAYNGSFYANSSVGGNWEDFISRDLVSYVDSNYRTIPRAESRGITGHSMGGYGSIVLGMKHPEVFGAVYSLSACCTAMLADLGPSNSAWRQALKFKSKEDFRADSFNSVYAVALTAMAAAFSPNPKRAPLFVDFPFQLENNMLVPNGDAYRRFQAKLPVNMVTEYTSNLLKLRGIYIDYGVQEEFSHIPIGSLALSRELSEHGIPHTFEIYQGDHNGRIPERLETRVLPFFSRILKFVDVR